MKGDYVGMVEGVQAIAGYIDKIQILDMYEVKNYAINWLELKMGSLHHIPTWIIAAETASTSMMPLVIGRDELLYATYLFLKNKYNQLVAYLERIKGWYSSKGWGDSLSANVLLAIGYFKLHDEDKALDILKETYDMTHHNNIISPFVEAGGVMRTLVEHARQSEKHDFDSAWLDNIYRKSSTHAKRLSFMMKEHAKRNKRPVNMVNLSKRKADILHNLSQGLTRDEIADENGVSVSTVKGAITSIYNKLGAVNRADAVRIAAEMGLIL